MDSQQRAAYRAAIGARLRAARQAKGLSRRKLAANVRINERTLFRYEHGESPLPAEDLGIIATHLGCSAEWVVGDPEAADDFVCLIDALVERKLLTARVVDDDFRAWHARVATLISSSTIRVRTVESFARRLDAVMDRRVQLEHGRTRDADGAPRRDDPAAG